MTLFEELCDLLGNPSFAPFDKVTVKDVACALLLHLEYLDDGGALFSSDSPDALGCNRALENCDTSAIMGIRKNP
jgi:hypothetical protein